MSDNDLWVAGLNHGAHDSSAALMRNGELVAVAEQERFSRRKRAIDQPPVEALKWCLDSVGIKLSQLSAIGLGSDLDALGQWMGLDPAERRQHLPYDDPERLMPAAVFGDEVRPSLIPIKHHIAHAASCLWPSGFADAAILVIDNRGEDCSTTLALGNGDGIEILDTYPVEHSLGLYYRIATQYAGMYSKDGNAGKLMGLAPYGTPRYDAVLRHSPDGPLWNGIPAPQMSGRDLPPERTKQLLEHFERTIFPYTTGLKEEVTAYTDFAASVQRALEDTILGLVGDLHKRTGSKNLVLAGGVALNCTANGRVANEGPFENVFVQPMSHDAGVALGAAYEVSRQIEPETFRPQTMTHALWGPSFTDDEVAQALRAQGLRFERHDPATLARTVAQAIGRGAIVAWHQGRGEAGPRSLGARSLLGDPRTRQTLVRMNQIKNREMWRPLAPSVLAAQFNRFFIGKPNPFMIMAAQVRPEVRPHIPAVVHIDGSARPQAVEVAANPRFALLLHAFEAISGIPIVVNTSLNTAGMPLASRPEESISVFNNTATDMLAIESFIVTKN